MPPKSPHWQPSSAYLHLNSHAAEGPYEARLLYRSVAVAVFDCDIPVLPIEYCSPDQFGRAICAFERCVASECVPGRPRGSSQDSGSIRQIAAELRGESRAGRWADEVSFAHGGLPAFSHGRRSRTRLARERSEEASP